MFPVPAFTASAMYGQVKNVKNGKCLGVAADNLNPGAKILIKRCDNSDSESFQFAPTSGGLISIIDKPSAHCLTVRDQLAAGSLVENAVCTLSDQSEEFEIGIPSANQFTFKSKKTGLCLDATLDQLAEQKCSLTGNQIFVQVPPYGGSAIPAPTNESFFGASINSLGDPSTIESQTETFEQQIGRNLALHMHYYGFGSLATGQPTFPNVGNTQMADDISHHRIPVVSWSCNGIPFSTVASGTYNSVIDNTALAIKNFGYPIFLRYAWEMNTGASSSCQGGSLTPGADFIAAWQLIYSRFKALGVTNVAWLWNPNNNPDASSFYPGTDYVDWIGFDGYDFQQQGDFGNVFSPFYNVFKSYGKPLFIGETGACHYRQSNFLATARADIKSLSTNNLNFPEVRAFMYWDAAGQYTKCADSTNWILSDPAGISAFKVFGADLHFNAPTGL